MLCADIGTRSDGHRGLAVSDQAGEGEGRWRPGLKTRDSNGVCMLEGVLPHGMASSVSSPTGSKARVREFSG